MKRLLTVILVILLVASVFAGCGGNTENTQTGSDVTSEQTTQKPSADPDVTSEQTTQKPSADSDVTSEQTTEKPSADSGEQLQMFRESMRSSGKIGAVMYLGRFDGEMGSEEFYQAFAYEIGVTPLIRDIPCDRMIEAEGSEVYCIIPADADASVAVNEWIMNEQNEYAGEAGRVLYRSESSEPILIRGNISEYIPNIAVNIVDSSGNILSDYTPMLSGENGEVVLPFDEAAGESLLFDYSLYAQ